MTSLYFDLVVSWATSLAPRQHSSFIFPLTSYFVHTWVSGDFLASILYLCLESIGIYIVQSISVVCFPRWLSHILSCLFLLMKNNNFAPTPTPFPLSHTHIRRETFILRELYLRAIARPFVRLF